MSAGLSPSYSSLRLRRNRRETSFGGKPSFVTSRKAHLFNSAKKAVASIIGGHMMQQIPGVRTNASRPTARGVVKVFHVRPHTGDVSSLKHRSGKYWKAASCSTGVCSSTYDGRADASDDDEAGVDAYTEDDEEE